MGEELFVSSFKTTTNVCFGRCSIEMFAVLCLLLLFSVAVNGQGCGSIYFNRTCQAYQQPNCQGDPATILPQLLCAQGICLGCYDLPLETTGNFSLRIARDTGYQGGCTQNGCVNANYTVIVAQAGCQNVFFDKSIFCSRASMLTQGVFYVVALLLFALLK